MRQQSPSLKGSRVSSAQNNSIAVSHVEKQKEEKLTKQDRMKSYAKEQQNVSKRHEPVDPNKLIEQNTKLREQLRDLITHLDNIVKTQKKKQLEEKQKKYAKPNEPAEKKAILGKQEKQINENACAIKLLQKQLEQTYDINKIKEKEDKKRYLENEYRKLYQEFESQQKIDEKQFEGLKQIDMQEQEKQINGVRRTLQEEQKQNRQLLEEINKLEKEVQRLHNEKFTKAKQIQTLEQKIKEKKNKPVDDEIDEEKVKRLEAEIVELSKQRDIQVQSYTEKFKKLESQRNEVKNELEKKRQLMIKLEREAKINKVFIHEANRFLRMDERQTQRSSKPALSAPRKVTTPRKDTPSPKSEKGSLKKQPSQQIVEAIKEEQFEETVINVDMQQQAKRQPRQMESNGNQNRQSSKEIKTKSTEPKEQLKTEHQDPPQENNQNLSTHDEETKSIIEQQDNNNQLPQQPNIYRKPMMMLKKKS